MTDVYLYPVPAFANDADVMLTDPTMLHAARHRGRPPERYWKPCPIHDPGVCRPAYDRRGVRYCVPVVTTARSLREDLVERYGAIEGNKTYLAMRHNAQGPFAPGAKYDVTKAPKPRGKPLRQGTSARSANAGRRVDTDR